METLKVVRGIFDTQIKEEDLVRVQENSFDTQSLYDENGVIIQTRSGGDFAGHAFYLSDRVDWKLGKDTEGSIVLVPLKK
jgi:hypothetical protein